jgi:hypothetical protein
MAILKDLIRDLIKNSELKTIKIEVAINLIIRGEISLLLVEMRIIVDLIGYLKIENLKEATAVKVMIVLNTNHILKKVLVILTSHTSTFNLHIMIFSSERPNLS